MARDSREQEGDDTYLVFDMPQAHVTNEQLYMLLDRLNTKYGIQIAENKKIRERMEDVEKMLVEINTVMNTVNMLTTFIKFAASMVIAFGVIWAGIKFIIEIIKGARS